MYSLRINAYYMTGTRDVRSYLLFYTLTLPRRFHPRPQPHLQLLNHLPRIPLPLDAHATHHPTRRGHRTPLGKLQVLIVDGLPGMSQTPEFQLAHHVGDFGTLAELGAEVGGADGGEPGDLVCGQVVV